LSLQDEVFIHNFYCLPPLTPLPVVIRIPEHGMNEYHAVFNSAPIFNDLSHVAPDNILGFNPNSPAMGGIRGGSRYGAMMF
jgi:hypothetical protein